MPSSHAVTSELQALQSREVATTRTSRGRRDVSGRYKGAKGRLLATGIGAPPSENVRTATASVVDPYGNGLGRIQATVNRRVDILEQELSHGRLSEAAYRIGRELQGVFERAGRVGTTNWLGVSRLDPMQAHELRVLGAVITAQEIVKTLTRVRARVGYLDARLLQRVLGERMSFAQCAEVTGKNGERGAGYVGARFREVLEDLAEAWTARGAPQPAADDKHAASADTIVGRQRASIVRGCDDGASSG